MKKLAMVLAAAFGATIGCLQDIAAEDVTGGPPLSREQYLQIYESVATDSLENCSRGLDGAEVCAKRVRTLADAMALEIRRSDYWKQQ